MITSNNALKSIMSIAQASKKFPPMCQLSKKYHIQY